MTVKAALKKLHAERKRMNTAFHQHTKKYNCKTDCGGCTDRAKFQERDATLNFAIKVLGGRPQDEYFTTILDYYPKVD